MFAEILKWTRENLYVIETLDKGYPSTQIVIGERHFHARVQSEVLRILVELKEKFGLRLVGKEVVTRTVKTLPEGIDPERAMQDVQHMYEFIRRSRQKSGALWILKALYPEIRIEPVDDSSLRKLSGVIDTRFHEFFSLKRERGWSNMTSGEKEQYRYWLRLLKQILLRDRSNAMVRNLTAAQQRIGAELAVLICGASHTPYIEWMRPWSVSRELRATPVNYIIALPFSLVEINKREKDPFDFYTPADDLEYLKYG